MIWLASVFPSDSWKSSHSDFFDFVFASSLLLENTPPRSLYQYYLLSRSSHSHRASARCRRVRYLKTVSTVSPGPTTQTLAVGASRKSKPLKRFRTRCRSFTGLKPGENEKRNGPSKRIKNRPSVLDENIWIKPAIPGRIPAFSQTPSPAEAH